MAKKKTDDYRLTLSDDNSNEHLWSVRFTTVGAIVTAITVFVVAAALFFIIYGLTPIRTLIPGYPDADTKREAIENAIRIDSLERAIGRWELYSENLRRVVRGEAPLKIDSVLEARNRVASSTADPSAIARKDSILKAEVAEESRFEIKDEADRILPVEGMHFFCPLKGIISKGYDKVLHPCIEISAPENSVVMAVLEGTVISAGWSDGEGYTIRIQHPGDIISTYMHNQKLMKKAGDKVNAGTTIGLVGKSAGDDSACTLTFELWHKGEAVDPAKYISF